VRVVFLGATKGMGRALARRMAERKDELFLLGRNLQDLEASAADLKIRGGHERVNVGVCDLEDSDRFAPALEAARAAMGDVDAVVITAGLFAVQEKLESDLDLTRRLLTVNFTHTLLFCEHARRMLLARGGGTLCVFSSVAGERGRRPVAIYGASKAGLSRYLEALDHRHRAEGLKVVCVHPGFVRTGMTDGLKPPPFAGEPDEVAHIVLRAIDRGTPLVYAPRMWALVMLVIRWLPRFVMRRVGF